MIYQEYFFPDKYSTVPVSQFATAEQSKTGNINQLSAKYGISKARIEAILRLKMTEKEWEKSNKVRENPIPSPVPLSSTPLRDEQPMTTFVQKTII